MTKQLAKKVFRILFILASIGSLYFVPWVIIKAWLLPLPDTVQEQLNDGTELGFDGIIVYVDQRRKPAAYYAAGWHNRANKIPAYPQALFKIASISKLYVAVAITKLVSTKRLSLDKTLADYFPELLGRIENAELITIRQMVQHRSGIPNFTDQAGFWEHPPLSTEEILQLVVDLPADFAPGEDWGYSNTNYLLLRQLIEKAVGYSHEQYIKESILIPLSLKHTYGSLNEVEDLNQVMSGYYVGIEADLKTENPWVMLATAEDVGKFLRALNDGSVFKDGEKEIYDTLYEYEHTGLIPGYQSFAKYYKDEDTIIVEFYSTTDFSGYEWNLAQIINSRIAKIVRKVE